MYEYIRCMLSKISDRLVRNEILVSKNRFRHCTNYSNLINSLFYFDIDYNAAGIILSDIFKV